VVVKGGGFRMVSMVSIWFQFVGFNSLVSIQWFQFGFNSLVSIHWFQFSGFMVVSVVSSLLNEVVSI
jgi:hypothetical protein